MSWGIGDRVGVAVSAGTIATFNSRRPGPVPSLLLDFAGTGTLDPRVTFTRSTTGTYYNSSGVLSTAAINAPRFDYNPSTLAPLGLLIEQSSTNLLTYSQDFSNAVWTKTNATITTTAGIAPDGTQTLQLLVESTATGLHAVSETYTKAASAITYTQQVIFKAKERTYSYIQVSDGSGNGAIVYFNLSTGAISTAVAGVGTAFTSLSATITAQGNNTYKCTLTSTSNTATSFVAQFGSSTDGSTNSYTGDGYSGIYIWGAQLEALAFPTSYIPTTSAQVTRASDNASMTGANFSSWYNIGQGSLYTEWVLPSLASVNRTSTQITDSTVTNRFIVQADNGGAVTRHLGFINGSAQIIMDIGSVTAGSSKDMYAYQAGNSAASRNGSTVATSSYANIPSGMDRMAIGNDSGVSFLNGYFKKIAYYPIRVTNAQLQSLTGS
jgi:hypothetical protein